MLEVAKRFRWLWMVGLVVLTVIVSWQVSLAQTTILHPLDQLTKAEIKATVSVIRKGKTLSDAASFPTISLQEPPKREVLEFTPDHSFKREAFVVVLERNLNKTYEAIVDLKALKLTSWKEVSGVQPALLDEEYELTEELVKADPRWQKAMRKRGLTKFDEIKVDGWAAGNLSDKENQEGARLMRGLSYYKGKNLNFYGNPVEGVMATVNLNTRKVVDFVDTRIVPISKEDWDFDEQAVKKLRAAPKSLKIQQPNGASFQITSNEVSWQKWKFRYMMHPREGLVLYIVRYEDEGKLRPVLYRASLSEMVVPYADTDPTWVFRNAFDVGEYRVGRLANTMELGKEIPENAVLLDAVFADDSGEPYVQKAAVGIYEKDDGMLWKHYDYVSERNEVRRARSLVMTFTSSIGNYDYGLSWIFHQDGTLELQSNLTGIMLAKGAADTVHSHEDRFGHLVADNLLATHHQHFFTFRLDMDVDGQDNSVNEMNIKALPVSQDNPKGNAFVMEETQMESEAIAMRDLDMKQSRKWKIINADRKNALGDSIGYALIPGENSVPYASDQSNVRKRAGFINHHFWVTQYKPGEMYAGGDYPNQSKLEQGLPQWESDNESLVGKDLVLWYTMGITHIPRPEEWPIMSVHQAGFKLVPTGFFPKNPALDVPISSQLK